MKNKILVTQWIPDICNNTFKDRLELIYPSKEKRMFSREEQLNLIADADGIFLASASADKELINAGKNLKVIGNLGVGYDAIDIEAATAKNIAVINSPTTVTESTAELTITLIMACMRNIMGYDLSLRNGEWKKTAFDDYSTEIFGHTLGIVGFGRIGKSVAKKAQAMGMTIVYYDPFKMSEENETAMNVKYMPLDNLFAFCDCVSLHMPYTPENHHLINEKTLSKIKKGAYLINVARGPIVKESALVEALNNGTLRGAALDVFEFEPAVGDALKACKNTVLVPHIGTQTLQVRINMFNESMNGMCEILEGNRPYNLVNTEITL